MSPHLWQNSPQVVQKRFSVLMSKYNLYKYKSWGQGGQKEGVGGGPLQVGGGPLEISQIE